MNLKYIVFLISLTFILFFLNKIFIKKKDKYYNIVMVILSLVSCYSIDMNYAQFIMKESRYLTIPFAVIVIVAIFIATLSRGSIKISIDNLILIIILVNTYIYFYQGMISDYVKYIQIFILYLSIFCISFLYKNIRYYDYKKILNVFSYVAIFNCILGIMQFITGKKLLPGVFNESIMYSEGVVGAKRIVGIAGTNNAAGNLSAIIFAIVTYNYLRTKKKIHLLAILSTLVFSILTLTRIGYLAIAVECLIFFSIT